MKEKKNVLLSHKAFPNCFQISVSICRHACSASLLGCVLWLCPTISCFFYSISLSMSKIGIFLSLGMRRKNFQYLFSSAFSASSSSSALFLYVYALPSRGHMPHINLHVCWKRPKKSSRCPIINFISISFCVQKHFSCCHKQPTNICENELSITDFQNIKITSPSRQEWRMISKYSIYVYFVHVSFNRIGTYCVSCGKGKTIFGHTNKVANID